MNTHIHKTPGNTTLPVGSLPAGSLLAGSYPAGPAQVSAFRSRATAITAFSAALALAGCSSSALRSDFGVGAPTPAKHYTGNVFGGQQPIVGAVIQLYAVNTTTLKGASNSVLTSTPAPTDSNGNFSLTGDYSCAAATDVYLVATGGDPGSGVNSSVSMVAALGDCATLQANAANIFINVNEISTVAAAYALAPFAQDVTHIGSPNATAMTNAFNTVNELVSLGSGITPGPSLPQGGSVPSTEINTLANIIAACVNTSGAASSPCTSLFGATGASDSFGAALAIAKNPGSSTITALQALSTPTAPFQPSLNTQPNDFTVAISYNAAGTLATPYAIAIDATGNAWITNEAGTAVTSLSSNGAVLGSATPAGLFGAQGIAVDTTGNVWVANTAGNSVLKLATSNGTVTGSTAFTVGGVAAPTAIALDSAGNAFVANFNGNSVTKLTNSGAAASGSPFTAGGAITVPSGIALDTTGSVLVTSGTGAVVKLTNAGALSSTLTDNALQGPLGVAVDSSNQVYATGSTTGNSIAGAIAEFSAAGSPAGTSPSNTGLATPFGVATAGTSVFVANSTTSGSLAQLTFGSATPVSPTAGFGSLNTPVGVAVDASGNVWTANSGSNTISKFVGLTVPVVTPLAVNVGP